MARETDCPICSAHIPLTPEDRVGEHVWCSYCGTRLRITKIRSKGEDKKQEDIEVEEDW